MKHGFGGSYPRADAARLTWACETGVSLLPDAKSVLMPIACSDLPRYAAETFYQCRSYIICMLTCLGEWH